MHKLHIKDITKTNKKTQILHGISIEVSSGEIVGLLGPNGAGKTTTFYMIVGIVQPESGKVMYNEIDITKYPMYKRARLGIGYLAQEPSLFRNLSVEDNIMAVLEMKNMKKKERIETKDKLIEEFKLGHVVKSMGFSLSGGERRRVEIARTLANDPDFILLDEPFAGVDPIAVEDIQNIVMYLRDRGLGILITDHNVRETLRITERAYIMAEGKVLIGGTSAEIAENETARKVYLGEKFKL